jgi:hypothetical protein
VLEILNLNELSQEHLIQHNHSFQIAYSCFNSSSILVFEIILYDPSGEDSIEKEQRIVTKKWQCSRPSLIDFLRFKDSNKFKFTEILKNEIRSKTFDIALSDKLKFRPDLLNKVYEPMFKLKIRLRHMVKQLGLRNDSDEINYLKREYKGYLIEPYSRESKTAISCLNFFNQILYDQELKTLYQCDYEDGLPNKIEIHF